MYLVVLAFPAMMLAVFRYMRKKRDQADLVGAGRVCAYRYVPNLKGMLVVLDGMRKTTRRTW